MSIVAVATTTATATRTVIETVGFERPVPAGEVPFPVMWEGRLYQLTGTPAAIGRAAGILLSGLPTLTELNIPTILVEMFKGPHNITSIGMGGGDGQDFLTGDSNLMMAFRRAMMR